jgi:hypothetical protein
LKIVRNFVVFGLLLSGTAHWFDPAFDNATFVTRKITQPRFFCYDFEDATFVMRKITQPRFFVVSPFVL